MSDKKFQETKFVSCIFFLENFEVTFLKIKPAAVIGHVFNESGQFVCFADDTCLKCEDQ